MRHGKKINHLGRTTSHRKAMLANMANSLIESKRITTTVAKAKALRKYVEPLITKSKTDTTHSRRTVFSYLQNKYAVTSLFGEIAEKVADRPGGYTRIIKLGNRLGDNADMCMIELVDYNEIYSRKEEVEKPKTRRSRRGGKKEDEVKAETKTAEVKADVIVEDVEVEDVVATTENTDDSEAENTEKPDEKSDDKE
ncbi:MAG: 50S ribosomal protein L17 [Cyclobacteriaceae bacterium]|nr:50S ribosomal protein L17 [Cyclobacteriaceae bacterium]